MYAARCKGPGLNPSITKRKEKISFKNYVALLRLFI